MVRRHQRLGYSVARSGASRVTDRSACPLLGHRGGGRAAPGVRRQYARARGGDRPHRQEGSPPFRRPGWERCLRGRRSGRGERVMRVPARHRSTARGVSPRRIDGRRQAPRQPRAFTARRHLSRTIDGPHRRGAFAGSRVAVRGARAPVAAAADGGCARSVTADDRSRDGVVSARAGRGDRRGARIGRPRVAGPSDRRPDRGARPGTVDSGVSRGESGRARGRRIRRVHLGRRAYHVRPGAVHGVRAGRRGRHGSSVCRSGDRESCSRVRGGSRGSTSGGRTVTTVEMGTASRQRCARCGRETSDLEAAARCASCGGLLEVIHPPPAVRGAELRALFARRRADGSDGGSGVWRYREVVLPSAGPHITSHPEGNTPLLSRDRVAEWAGVPALSLKHEGHNPTGSFKDRGMTVGVTQARRIGARAVACASTGNTSASLAAYAAQAGIPALVFVPAGQVALGKLAQSLAYGARTLLVRGDFDACLRLVQEASERLGIYLLNSINPFRVEGQKTIALEVLEQLGWEAPDWLALPAGNLGNTAAFGKALREARELGLIDRVPRIAAVQAEGASPFAQTFREQFSTRPKV